MQIKRKNRSASKSSHKSTSCLSLFSCFRCPKVIDPEDKLHASAVADRRDKSRLQWLPWPKCKRKKKMKTTIPFDLQCAKSNLSFVPSSNSNDSTPKSRNSKGCCKKNEKTPIEVLPDAGAAPSRTASMDSMDRTASRHSSPRTSTSQFNSQPFRSDLLRHVIQHTAANRFIGRVGGRRLRLGAGLWVMVTSLGVMVVFGRTGAVLFLSSCWYIVPMVIDILLSNERLGN